MLAQRRADLARATDRLNRLLDVFIDGTITKDDFTSHKERLVQEKATLADSVARMEVHGANRFKPLIDFITASRQAKYDAQPDDFEELRNWHKKIGSNLILAAGILLDSGVFGSANGQETETDESRSAGQSPSLTDVFSRNTIAWLRGGFVARSPISPDIGKRVESPRIEENKAISRPSADGVGVRRMVGVHSDPCGGCGVPVRRQAGGGWSSGHGLPVARIEDRFRVTRPLSASVVRCGRKLLNFRMAERGGFEPPVPF